MKSRLASLLLAMGLVCLALPVKAQDYSKIRIVRLSFVEGTVEYQRPGQDWQDAKLNLPIQEGYAIRTADGFAEVEFEDALTVRLATNSTVEFTELSLQSGGRVTKLTVPQGTSIVSAKLGREDAVSVIAPNLNFSLPRNGRFRLDISPSESWLTALHGKVAVASDGTTSVLNGGHTLHVSASGSGSPEVAANPRQDDFDKWVSHREDELGEARSETSSVFGGSSYSEGFADLYNYGVWSYIPGYGAGWMPYGMGTDWMPFTDGSWQFMGGTGWNWISGEPWGWLPYHFGSWVNSPGVGWAWLPIGPTTWVPATARWVQLNHQLAWIPNAPPPVAKPTKLQLASAPATAILAGQATGGAIRAGASLPINRAGTVLEAGTPPTVSFAPSAPRSTSFASGPANPRSFAVSAPSSLTRGTGAPRPVGAPRILAAPQQTARLSSVPRTMAAPHAPPVPTMARGASTAGFRGGLSGGARTMSAGPATSMSASPSAPVGGSISHAGGSAGSSGGHR